MVWLALYVRKHTMFFYALSCFCSCFSSTNPRIIWCTYLRICWLEHVAAIQWASIIITIRLNESWVIKQSKFTIILRCYPRCPFLQTLQYIPVQIQRTYTYQLVILLVQMFVYVCERTCVFVFATLFSFASLFLIFRHLICC